MLETNLTEFFNETLTMNSDPMTITGTINGSMPVSLNVQGNITTITHIPAWDYVFQLQIVDTICLLVIAFCCLYFVVESILKRRSG